MLPFNASVFIAQYANLMLNGSTQTTWTAEQLSNIWNNEALILGSKVLSIFRDNTPINPSTSSINAWNASTNTPTLSNNNPQINTSYLCTVGGNVNFGAGDIQFNVYDIVSFNSLLMQWQNIGQPIQYYWAGMVMAHLVSLYNRPVVGRLNNATEGDVSGQFTYQDTNGSKWWNQTTYGARIWERVEQRGGFTSFVNIPYGGILYQGNNNVYGN
jgi:hypothetical protein